MKYAATVTVTFEFEVPGDDPNTDLATRNVDTAGAAAEVIQAAAVRIAEPSLRYEKAVVQFSGEPVDDTAGA